MIEAHTNNLNKDCPVVGFLYGKTNDRKFIALKEMRETGYLEWPKEIQALIKTFASYPTPEWTALMHSMVALKAHKESLSEEDFQTERLRLRNKLIDLFYDEIRRRDEVNSWI